MLQGNQPLQHIQIILFTQDHQHHQIRQTHNLLKTGEIVMRNPIISKRFITLYEVGNGPIKIPTNEILIKMKDEDMRHTVIETTKGAIHRVIDTPAEITKAVSRSYGKQIGAQ